jgi:hypothetical protein
MRVVPLPPMITENRTSAFPQHPAARILLLLSHFCRESRAELMLPRISQANLAQMIGTTRSRVSHFMNKLLI